MKVSNNIDINLVMTFYSQTNKTAYDFKIGDNVFIEWTDCNDYVYKLESEIEAFCDEYVILTDSKRNTVKVRYNEINFIILVE